MSSGPVSPSAGSPSSLIQSTAGESQRRNGTHPAGSRYGQPLQTFDIPHLSTLATQKHFRP